MEEVHRKEGGVRREYNDSGGGEEEGEDENMIFCRKGGCVRAEVRGIKEG